jgi:hypothetical protein
LGHFAALQPGLSANDYQSLHNPWPEFHFVDGTRHVSASKQHAPIEQRELIETRNDT